MVSNPEQTPRVCDGSWQGAWVQGEQAVPSMKNPGGHLQTESCTLPAGHSERASSPSHGSVLHRWHASDSVLKKPALHSKRQLLLRYGSPPVTNVALGGGAGVHGAHLASSSLPALHASRKKPTPHGLYVQGRQRPAASR